MSTPPTWAVAQSDKPDAETFRCVLSPTESLPDREYRFMLAGLRQAPTGATQMGYHGDADHPLDLQLEQTGPAAIAAQRALQMAGKACFDQAKGTNAEDIADLLLVRDSIEGNLYYLDTLQGYKFHPENYPEMIGSGLFFPLTETKRPELDRMTGVVARMEQVPRVIDEAEHNVQDADPIFIETAIEENEGAISVVGQIGEMIAVGSPLRARYEVASTAANAALKSYDAWLKNDLAKRPHNVTWRTGPEKYARIFAFALGPGTHETPDSVLAKAEQDLTKVRAQMLAEAMPLHKQWFPDHGDHSDLTGDALENKIIAEVIDRINDDHVEPGQLLDKIKEQAKGIRAFIVQKDLMTLSDRDNLHIVPTPEFLRGSFSVAGFHSAPVLAPGEEAEFWVTPIDSKATKEQADSKLREYNNWMLQYLTMHEALPGHYTQFEHANNLQPESRRVVRAMLGSGSYAEGWGEYAVKEMEDAGYADHDPRFVLMVQKIRLRVIANSILDIRMQSRNMTDDEAFDLMEHKAFQTHAEATGKLRRAKLTSGQLITYYVGFHQWIDLRDHMQKRLGAKWSLKKFNDAALDAGPLPIPLLEPLLATKFHVQ